MRFFLFLTSPDSRPMALWAVVGAVVGIGAQLALQLIPSPLSPFLSAESAFALALLGGVLGGGLWWSSHPAVIADSLALARLTERAMRGDSEASEELERLLAARRAALRELAGRSDAARRRLLLELTTEHAGLAGLLEEPDVQRDATLTRGITEDRLRLAAEIETLRTDRRLAAPEPPRRTPNI